MSEVPPGYRPLPGGGMALIDPAQCPAGHAWRWGQRGYRPCAEHRGHPQWTCACGQQVYLDGGEHVTKLECR